MQPDTMQLLIGNIKEIKATLVRLDTDVKALHLFIRAHMNEEEKNISNIRVDIAKMQKELLYTDKVLATTSTRAWGIFATILTSAMISAGALIVSRLI